MRHLHLYVLTPLTEQRDQPPTREQKLIYLSYTTALILNYRYRKDGQSGKIQKDSVKKRTQCIQQ